MLAQQLPGPWGQQANMQGIPLDLHLPSDPTWRRTIIGRLDLDTTVQMHRALAILVIAEGLEGQRQQGGTFFGKHGRHLPFGRTVNARVRPALFPTIQITLRLLQAFEAQPFQGRFLRMAYARLDLAFGESHRMQVVWEAPESASE